MGRDKKVHTNHSTLLTCKCPENNFRNTQCKIARKPKLRSRRASTFKDVRALLTKVSADGGEGAAGRVENVAISDGGGDCGAARGGTTTGTIRKRNE